MSSREIAEITGKKHFHVFRDISEMLIQLGEESSGYIHNWMHPQNGQEYKEYLLTKRLTECLVTGYSAILRIKVIDRLHELEKQDSPKLPGNYVEALEALLESEKQKALMAPKAEVYDRVIDRKALLNATQVGQKIGMSAVALNKHLESIKVYNRAVKRGRTFQQWFVDAGHGEMKITEQGYPQCLFSNSGEIWIIGKLTSEGII